ncbi:pitrilysin family protein [Pedobacter sp. P351]|uniref:M16 family metallopeptidase n=1 Tax=Pedobacter superstes TaxID=3133441 RepID=UPI0030B59EFB
MVDRTLAPAFRQVEQIQLIKAEPYVLDNNLKLYVINGGEQELIRIELIFKNVNWNPSKPLQAYTVNSMLVEGTDKLNAQQIAEKIDYYGAFLQVDYNYDYSSVTLYTLTKHLEATLPVVKAIVTGSAFSETELETFKINQKQKLMVSLEKNDYLGRRLFNNALFGDTIYGYKTDVFDYDRLDRTQLLEYFESAYQPSNCTVIASGKIDDNSTSLLNKFFGTDWDSGSDVTENVFSFTAEKGKEHYFERPDALQSAIRLGGLSVNRSHADFPGLQVLNTVLGGYFSSRLMSNIREDKGYTYGIGSAIVSLKNAGYFVIGSEVGAEVCTDAVNEIEKEIKILQTELISREELELVRNYMMGSLLGSLENALSHADKFKNILFSGLTYEYYNQYIDVVRTISAEELQQLAIKYFDFSDLEKVIVGKK